MKRFNFLLISALLSSSVHATTIISKSMSTHLSSVYQYIQEDSPYTNIKDEFIVVDMGSGSSEKFVVDHIYNGEFITTVVPAAMTAQETTAIKDSTTNLKNVIDAQSEGFWAIPEKLGQFDTIVNAVNSGRYTFVRNDISSHVAGKLQNFIATALSGINGISGNTKLDIPVKNFQLKDKTSIEVEVTYGRYQVKVKVLSVVDKYNNSIPLTSADLKVQDYRVPISDAGYAQLLIDFLRGQNITVTGTVSSGGGSSGGSVIIIDCNDDGCKVEMQ